MKTPHPHAEMITEWVKDTSRVVQCYSTYQWRDCLLAPPAWDADFEYRFKPEPNKIENYTISSLGDDKREPYSVTPDLFKAIFDGDTNKLKSVE